MITKFPSSGVFFTSDTHFGHENILKFTPRPWSTIEEHDVALIENWNSVVNKDDTVFHLGDFAFGKGQKFIDIRKQLNGHIYLIKGNHDDKNLQNNLFGLFEDVLYQARIQIDGTNVYLNHFPFLCFAHGDPTIYKNNYSINLFGHVHSGPDSTSIDCNRLSQLYPTQYDVGVDNNNYTPISWEDVKTKINAQIETYFSSNC